VSGFLEEVKTLISARSRFHGAVLDQLHLAYIEIVSPNFMNQRQLPERKVFIPPPENTEISSAEDKIQAEERIFDKAEEAEALSLQRLDLEKKLLEKKALEVALEAAKKAEDTKAEELLVVQIEKNAADIKGLQEELKGPEEENKKD
jgi:hypothetical protein